MTAGDAATWDAEAGTFDDEPDHGLHDSYVRDAWRTLMMALMPPAPARVADLGCGTGTLSLLLAQDGYSVAGVDFSPQMIRRATAKAGTFPGSSFVVGDAAAPPFAGGVYDAVLCRHVLWALPDPAAALAHWAELLGPDGRLVLVEGSWSSGSGLTGTQTVELVEEAGFRADHRDLSETALWGRRVEDERYVVVGRR